MSIWCASVLTFAFKGFATWEASGYFETTPSIPISKLNSHRSWKTKKEEGMKEGKEQSKKKTPKK